MPLFLHQLPSKLWQAYLRNLTDRPLTTKAVCAAVIFSTSDAVTQWLEHRDRVVLHHHQEKRRRAGPRPDGRDAAATTTSTHSDDNDAFVFQIGRALSGAGFGVVATVWLHHWWNYLERTVSTARFVPLMVQRNRLATALTKVVVDQSIGAPIYIYTYYILTNVLGNAAKVVGAAPDSTNHPQPDDVTHRLMALCKDAKHKADERFWPTMLQHWQVWPAVHTLNFYFVPLHHRVLIQNTVLVGWSGYLSHLNHAAPALVKPIDDPAKETSMPSPSPPHPAEPRAVVLRRTSLVLSLPDENAVAKEI